MSSAIVGCVLAGQCLQSTGSAERSARMKVFISWSGETSHRVAAVLRTWLPSVIQAVEPYVSSQDIDKGARWSTDIAAELEASSFGVLCLTPDNLNAPWPNFEAGALSKSFDKGHVSPFLFGLARSDMPPGPLLQFQSTLFEHDDVLKLVTDINNVCEASNLDDARVEEVFEVWWRRLEAQLSEISTSAVPAGAADATGRDRDEVLDEILDLVRAQQRQLSIPYELLPPGYLEEVLSGRSSRRPTTGRASRDLFRWFEQLIVYARQTQDPELTGLVRELMRPVEYLLREEGSLPPRHVREWRELLGESQLFDGDWGGSV